jgi:hypothetical protein
MLRMTDNMLLTVLFVVFIGSTFILGYWLGRDTRSKRELSRTSSEYRAAHPSSTESRSQ